MFIAIAAELEQLPWHAKLADEEVDHALSPLQSEPLVGLVCTATIGVSFDSDSDDI